MNFFLQHYKNGFITLSISYLKTVRKYCILFLSSSFLKQKKNKKNKKKEKTRTEPFQKGSNYKCGECFPNTCYPSGFSIAETQ